MPDKLQVLIQASEDLNFVIEYNNVTTSLSANANDNPSPSGRQLTSSTSINDDRLNLSGWLRTLSCNGVKKDITDVIPSLKRFIESQKYTVAEFATITTSQDKFTNMTLESVDIDRDYTKPQEMIISMTWRAINFSGGVVDSNFSIGGVDG